MGVAVIYARVSTGEQAKRNVANLPTQQKKCRDWSEHNGHSVLRAFVDKDSARSDDRESLQEMLSFCRQNRGKVTHVVIADLSRLARNVQDQAGIIARLRGLGITLHSVDEPTLDDTPAGRLCTNILGCINQFYSDSLSERVRYRMTEALKSGRIVWQAPLGYCNVGQNGTKTIALDPERAPLVRQAFEMIGTGSYSAKQVLHTVTALGLRTKTGRRLSTQGFSQMLRNKTYAGYVESKTVQVKGKFEPLVSEELFDRVQKVIDGRANHKPHERERPDFILRGFVKCGSCSTPLTAGWAKGRSKLYGYYWCWNKGCKAVKIKKEVLESLFLGLLGMMQPTAELLARLPEIAGSQWEQRQQRLTADKRTLSDRLNEQRTLNHNLIEAKVTGKVNDDEYSTMKKVIAERIAEIEAQHKALENEHSTIRDLMQSAKVQVLNLAGTWQKAEENEKRELQNSLFPEGLLWSHQNDFFEPGNITLSQAVSELVTCLLENGRGQRI